MNARELADKIARTLRDAGHQAYFVGGCVRDLELGREPADYDVSTDARPERVQELFPDSLAIGAQFGVILVTEDGAEVEVATFRSDIGYSDGRHPDRVVYTDSAKEDVLRRDFTINGLLLDPRTNEVLDYVNGRADLARAHHSRHRRARAALPRRQAATVRAVRFAARFNFAIEPETAAAIRRLAPEILVVSAERLRDELTKILTEGAARRGFELLDELGLLPHVLPEIARMKGVEQPPQFHPEGDVWIHTLLMLEMLPGRRFAHSRLGHAAPRCRQAADFRAANRPRRPHPLRWPRRSRHQNGGRNLPPLPILE